MESDWLFNYSLIYVVFSVKLLTNEDKQAHAKTTEAGKFPWTEVEKTYFINLQNQIQGPRFDGLNSSLHNHEFSIHIVNRTGEHLVADIVMLLW